MADVTITPAVIDIIMPMAVTNSINFTFRNKDQSPIDISLATLVFTVKSAEWDSDPNDSSAKIKKELSIVDGVSGKANLFITDDDSFIPVGDYYHDIKIIQPRGDSATTTSVAVQGSFVITADSSNRVVALT